MSTPFDDLARTLATPMPRNRALRAIGAALAIDFIPALRPGKATASALRTQQCTGNTARCFVEIPFGTHEGGCYYPKYEKCCKGPNNDPVHPNQMSWTCGKDFDCGSAAGGFCKCTTKCTDGNCCPRSKGRCVNGTCCPAIRTTKGSGGKPVACCPSGTIAVPGAVGLCCRKGDLNCCDKHDIRKNDDELSPLGPGKGKLCVNGKIKRA
jgi:hypothetical protein